MLVSQSVLDFSSYSGTHWIFPFHEMVTKADKHGFDQIKTQTLHQFVSIIMESDSPSVARTKLLLDEVIEEEDSWDDDPKHSYNGFWNKNCFVNLTKICKPLPDSIVTHCYECGTIFTMIQRKHHCRACGKIFCYKCSRFQIVVPQEFQSYIQTSVLTYLYQGQERVCEKCFLQIQDYYTLQQNIQFLKIGSFSLQILWRITKLNKLWKKSVLFYLSILRENLFKFSKQPLLDYEKRFLLVNHSLLLHHSCWTLCLLKLDKPITLDGSSPSTCCAYTICSSICRNKVDLQGLGLLEMMKVLDGGYSEDVIRNILLCIRELKDEQLKIILPYLISTCDEKSLLFILQPHVTKIYPIFALVYWLFIILQQGSKRRRYDKLKDYLLLLDPDFSSEFITINSFLGCLEENNNVDHLKIAIQKIDLPIPSLFHPFKKIKRIDIQSIKTKVSASAPTFLSYYLDDGTKESLLYKREDIRKDLYSIMILQLFIDVLQQHQIPIPFITYQIIPTSVSNGLIEVVKNSKTLHDIILDGSLNNYLQNSIHHDLSIKKLSDNFIQSFAFWTVATYLLGLGDRHLDNIMVSDTGVLFHIDFGFILGKDIKPYAPLVRVDTFMIEGIGGTTKLNYFKELCTKIFLVLRKYVFLFTPAYHLFVKADPPITSLNITSSYLNDFLTTRFLVGQTDEDASKYMDYLIDSSKDAFSQKISDYIHSYKSVTTVTSRWSSWLKY
jgi:hypothetical protein